MSAELPPLTGEESDAAFLRQCREALGESYKDAPNVHIDWLIWNRTPYGFCDVQEVFDALRRYAADPRDEWGNPEDLSAQAVS